MKLKSILKTLSVEYLDGIQHHWGISPADLSEAPTEDAKCALLVGNLYQRIQNRQLWERATASLTDRERGLVNFLAIHGGDLDADEVTHRYFEGDVKAMITSVKSLGRRGIVFFDDVPGVTKKLLLVGIPEPFLRFIELPSYWEGYLGNFLKEFSTNELKHIATQGLRLEVEANCKNYLIWLLRRSLLDPKFLRRYLERLPDGPREIFTLLEQRKGACVYRDLLELNIQRQYDHQRVDALQWLLNTSGLVFTAVAGGNKYSNLLMIPRDVYYIIANHFKADERTFTQLDSVSVVTKEERPNVVLENSNTLLRDLVALCNWIDRHPVKVLATEGIGKNDLKKVIPFLSRLKSVKYAEFLSLFAIQRKFLVSTGKTYRVSQSFLEWLNDAQGAYRELLAWWLTTTDWNEEFVDGNTIHVEPKATGLVGIVPLRRLVLEVLRDMPRDRWLSFDAFCEEVTPKIAQAIPKRGVPFVYDKHTRSNELVVESVVAECLHWLGLVAVGLQAEDDAEIIGSRRGDGKKLKAAGSGRGRPRKQAELKFAFRFTDLGRFVFARPLEEWGRLFDALDENEPQPMRYDAEHFIVQQTQEIVVPPDVRLGVFYQLNEICEVRSLDVMSILAVTRESLRAGMDRGLTADDILRFLEKGARTPLPQSISLLVKECGNKHGEVNMGFAGGYLIIDDAPLLAQLRANKKLSVHIKDVIDDRIVILTQDTDIRRLGRELQKIGFMPRLAAEHVHVSDEDTYHLSLSREDMYSMLAAVRYAMTVADEKGRAVAEERLVPLLERLRPNVRAFQGLTELSDTLLKTWQRASQSAQEAQMAEIKEKFAESLSHLVTNNTANRAPARAGYQGPNPAREPDRIREMLDYAIEHEHEVEIEYIKANQTEVREVVAPETLEQDRLLARCRTRNDAFSVYKVERIVRARLT
ncbi:MAG: helicase-associated domain-containing protein [Candidatus Sumerlaeia bacterium]|nr:helicase-associated domain-containing protein [Candidatus Sumerlaeia bacterium]